MDVVYILGTGSQWQDNELRYSLRSLCNLKHDRVFIIGERPDWLTNIVHIPAEDIYGPEKQRNAIHKLGIAIDSDVSDNFVLMNDDFFILRPTVVPTAYRRTLQEALDDPKAVGFYRQAIINTHERFPQGFDYSLHIPFIYNRDRLRDTIAEYGNDLVLLRSMYGNMHRIGGERMEDVKLHTRRDFNLGKIVGFGDFLSTSEDAVRDLAFQAWIDQRFPTPSHFEI